MNALSYIFLGFPLGILFSLVWELRNKRTKKIIYYSDMGGWVDIEKCPIPEDVRYYLSTDGKDVDYHIGIRYSKDGKPLHSYSNCLITHWMPFPMPPEKRKVE